MTDKIRDAVATVLTNVSNYPVRAQLYLLGESLGPLIDRVTEAVRSVLAEQGEPEGRRWFSAAYRSSNGNVIPIGDENVLREFPEAVVEEFRREDPDGPDYFLASRILPPWLPVEENKPHTEGNER